MWSAVVHFEDNEAVIKMIIMGLRPLMMRHVFRTHSVALDWLFDGINLDPKIQVKYVDTKNQLADLLTKRSFTRDEWCNLLRLFIIIFLSSLAAIVVQLQRANTMSKRIQERKTGEELALAKPRSTCYFKKPTEPEATLVLRFGCF